MLVSSCTVRKLPEKQMGNGSSMLNQTKRLRDNGVAKAVTKQKLLSSVLGTGFFHLDFVWLAFVCSRIARVHIDGTTGSGVVPALFLFLVFNWHRRGTSSLNQLGRSWPLN